MLRLVAIHNRALSEAQISQNFEAGVGEKFYLLFDVSAHSGTPDSYVLVEVSQFDSYGYLFNLPVYIVLDDDEYTPADIPVQGMRIGMNGAEMTTRLTQEEVSPKEVKISMEMSMDGKKFNPGWEATCKK